MFQLVLLLVLILKESNQLLKLHKQCLKIVHHLKIVEQINDNLVDYADFANITMPISNLIEYSDNYSDTSGGLWDFKRDEIDIMQM